jgi:hypothetical protein
VVFKFDTLSPSVLMAVSRIRLSRDSEMQRQFEERLSASRASAEPAPSQLGNVGGSCSLPVSASHVSRLPTICFMARVKRSLSFISSRLLKR